MKSPAGIRRWWKIIVDWMVNTFYRAFAFGEWSPVDSFAGPKKAKTTMGRTSDAKEKLLDVAFELIWDNSYGGVSVDQICERAGVNKGSFYHFFGSKADLAVAAYQEHWRQKQPEMYRLF